MVLISMSHEPMFFFLYNEVPDFHEQLDDFKVVDINIVACSHSCSFFESFHETWTGLE